MYKLLVIMFLVVPYTVNAEDDVYFVGGFKHLSSPTTAAPIDNRDEVAYDMPYIGIKYHKKSWDMNFQFNVGHMIQGDELAGDNPRTEFIVEKQFNINSLFK